MLVYVQIQGSGGPRGLGLGFLDPFQEIKVRYHGGESFLLSMYAWHGTLIQVPEQQPKLVSLTAALCSNPFPLILTPPTPQ